MAKGVEIRKYSIRVNFTFAGKSRREKLKDLKPTKENEEYAKSVIKTINHEIKNGTFNYEKWFPESVHLNNFRVSFYAQTWLDSKNGSVAPITYINYERWLNSRILPKWGHRIASTVTHSEVLNWVNQLKLEVKNKTVKELVSITRCIFRIHSLDNKISYNPVDGIIIRVGDDIDIDPFTRSEIDLITNCYSHLFNEKNMAVFHIWSGLRLSELLALAREDINLDNGTVKIRRALVNRGYKVPKTRSSTRTIELLSPALDVLKQHINNTNYKSMNVKVLQRDNKTKVTEAITPVFVCTTTQEPYRTGRHYRENFWTRHLNNCNVRYRPPQNCRHSFASQLLTSGMALAWIMSQTGHTTEAVLRKRYAKYINDDSPEDMAKKANMILKL